MRVRFSIMLMAAVLAGCASGSQVAGPAPDHFFEQPQAAVALTGNYAIGPLDKLNVSVFQVPELTLQSVQVDAAGQLNLPLIGNVQAAGKTAPQLSSDIAARLSATYLQSPQVTVSVAESVGKRVTVEGAVMQPGVFMLSGPTTLLQTIAMARGPDKLADLRRVAIFRSVQGKRAAAVFDLNAIRKGQAADPEIYGDDIVVVQGSGMKGLWQDVIRATPIIGIFRYF